MRKIAKLSAALVTYFMFASLALAAPLSNDTDTVVSQSINAGAMTMVAPVDVSLPDVTVSTDDQPVVAEALDWEVDDARGHKPASAPGWSLTLTATDFGDGAGSSIDVTNETLTPNDLVTLSGQGTGVSLGAGGALLDANDDGVSDVVSVASAQSTKGRGRFQGDVGISLVVPANSDAAAYTQTWTFTVQ